MESKNAEKLKEFTAYCRKHKDERFWQALRNWSQSPFLLKSKYYDSKGNVGMGAEDTFYWE